MTLPLDTFFNSLAESSSSLLMLDYDGTLAPFRVRRQEALPYPGITELLREIMHAGHTRVAIVSGRDANEIVPLLGLHPAPEIWGLHGLQRRRPGGEQQAPDIGEDTRQALSQAKGWLAYQQLESLMERKCASLAVHWRGLGKQTAEQVRGTVLLGWDAIARRGGLRLLEFDGGIEICASGPDKGEAVRTLLREMGPDVPAAYLGDDDTDESAFRAIEGAGLGILVRARNRPTSAQVWIKPPGQLLRFLARWREASGKQDECSGRAAAAVNG